MCGRVCSLSRVKGGAVGCVTRARWCVGGGACWLPVWAWVASRFLRAGGYWRVVGEGLFFLLFCCCRCSHGLRGIERWRRGASV